MATVTESEVITTPVETTPEERRNKRLFYRRNKANRYFLQDPHKLDTLYTEEGRPIYGQARKNAL